jgi:hypothetical protein
VPARIQELCGHRSTRGLAHPLNERPDGCIGRAAIASAAPDRRKAATMTPAQIGLIQQSFSKVAPISKQAAALFYGRLFEIAPEVKPLFRGDMDEQGRKLRL